MSQFLWRQQPRVRAQLERGPYYSGMISCIAPFSPIVDLRTHQGLTRGASSTVGPRGAAGLAFESASAASTAYLIDSPSPSSGFQLASGFKFSVLLLLQSTSDPSSNQWPLTVNFNGTTLPISLAIFPNATVGGVGYYSGTWNQSNVTTDIRGDGKWHVVVGTADQTAGELKYYVDGKLDAQGGAGGTSSDVNTNAITYGAYKTDTLSINGNIALGAVWWGRTLQSIEVADLSDNPWQLFVPLRRRRLYSFAAAGGGATTELSASDGLYMKDLFLKAQEKVTRDGTYLLDSRAFDEAFLKRDGLYLLDLAALQALRQRYALDSMYIRDDRLSSREHLQRDGLFVRDSWVREILKLVRDLMLLVDSATTELNTSGGVFTVTATDFLLLGDRTVREILKRVVDMLLLLSQSTTDAGKLVTAMDFLLVSDRMRKDQSKVTLDFLLLADAVIKDRSHQELDKILLGDAAAREKVWTRYAADQALLSDRIQRSIEALKMDQVLLHDGTRKLQEALIRDGLYLSDSVATAVFLSVAEFMTFIRIGMVKFLGITIGYQRSRQEDVPLD